jgi:hypothetical protein
VTPTTDNPRRDAMPGLGVALVLAIAGCRAPISAPVCPTCPTCPAPNIDVPPLAPSALVPEKPEDEPAVVPALLNTALAMIVVEAHEAEDEVDDAIVQLRIRIAPRDGGVAKVLERSSAPVACAEVQPEIVLLHGDEENEIVDVQVECVLGEEIVHVNIEHTIVRIAAKGTDIDAKIVFTGQSTVIDNRRLAVESDQLDFFVEAGALAVYRQRAAWCDRDGMKTLLGPDFAGCPKTRKRTLTLVKRIALDPG